MLVVPLLDESGNPVGKTMRRTQCEGRRALRRHPQQRL
jgi:hypothetical protein